MIPPKEKAEQLYNSMKGFRVKNTHAKKWDFWADVKQELEKL